MNKAILFLVFCFFLEFSTSYSQTYKWTETHPPGNGVYLDLTSSSDGTKLVVLSSDSYSTGHSTIFNTIISTSTNSGETWTKFSTNFGEKVVELSPDGTKLALWGSLRAADQGSELALWVYTQTDTINAETGTNWALYSLTTTNKNYPNGIKFISDKLYYWDYVSFMTSSDLGISWENPTQPKSWGKIAASTDGTKLAAIDNAYGGGYIYTSTDSGVTWTEQTAAGKRTWKSIASSSDGAKLAAVEGGVTGGIYTSTDSGVTWTEQTAAGKRTWKSIASSFDGTKLAAISYEYDNAANGIPNFIYASTDSGITWTEQTEAGQRIWETITLSSDGTKLAALQYFKEEKYHPTYHGYVFIGELVSNSVTNPKMLDKSFDIANNPSDDGRFYINNIEFDKIDEIKVFDMLGNHIKSINIHSLIYSNILDLSSYSNGNFILIGYKKGNLVKSQLIRKIN